MRCARVAVASGRGRAPGGRGAAPGRHSIPPGGRWRAKHLGAAYLVYLGIRRWRDRSSAVATGVPGARPLGRAFLDGAVVNLLNPKTALFFLAFLPQFVDASRGHVGAQLLALGALFVLLGVVTDGAYALAAGGAARWLRGHPRLVETERWIAGSTCVGLGLAATLSGEQRK